MSWLQLIWELATTISLGCLWIVVIMLVKMLKMVNKALESQAIINDSFSSGINAQVVLNKSKEI